MPTESVVSKSTEQKWAKLDSEVEGDTRGSYAALQDADKRKAGPWGDLVRLGKAYLGWDKSALQADRRELQNFVSLRATAENVNWQNESAFRDVFRRVIIGSIENDPARPDKMDREDGPYSDEMPAKFARNTAVRQAFMAAISQGATEEVISAALAAAKSGKAAKTDKDEAADES